MDNPINPPPDRNQDTQAQTESERKIEAYHWMMILPGAVSAMSLLSRMLSDQPVAASAVLYDAPLITGIAYWAVAIAYLAYRIFRFFKPRKIPQT